MHSRVQRTLARTAAKTIAAGNNATAKNVANTRAAATTDAATIRADAPAKPSATVNQMEQTRADMAENVNENLNQLEDIVNRRPDLFGTLSGRMTKAKEFIGTDDPDIAQMKQIEDNLGRALTSAHGMRNGKLVEDAVNGVLNGYKNSAGAIKTAIGSARNSVKTFTGDVQRKGGDAGGFSQAQDFGPANGKPEDSTGTLNGRKVIVKNGRIVTQ